MPLGSWAAAGDITSNAVLPGSASASNTTGICAQGHYQLMAFCSLEVAGSQSFLELSCVGRCSQCTGAPAAIQQKVLEYLQVLRGWHGVGG